MVEEEEVHPFLEGVEVAEDLPSPAAEVVVAVHPSLEQVGVEEDLPLLEEVEGLLWQAGLMVASSLDLGGQAVWTESHLQCVRLLPTVPHVALHGSV